MKSLEKNYFLRVACDKHGVNPLLIITIKSKP
jgi:hypothetical protein